MEFAPPSFYRLIDEFSALPGIGKRGARRIVLALMNMPAERVLNFSNDIKDFRQSVRQCEECGNISLENICSVCSNPARDSSVLCIVEKVQDALAIEGTNEYKGLYHVLHGRIDPLNNIGPDKINLNNLEKRIDNRRISEIILATSLDLEGETTASYIADMLSNKNISFSRPASGIPVGTDLEYSDPVTLVRAIRARVKING
jgi:recombination protein RecR